MCRRWEPGTADPEEQEGEQGTLQGGPVLATHTLGGTGGECGGVHRGCCGVSLPAGSHTLGVAGAGREVLTGNVTLLLWLLRAVPGNGPTADAFFIYEHNICFHIEIL